MLKFDEVKRALLSPDPSKNLDALIRLEQQAGSKVAEINRNLKDLLPQIKTILPDMTEDAEEALNGALDALIGWCSPACRYSDDDFGDPVTPLAKQYARLFSRFPIQDQIRGLSIILDEMKRNQSGSTETPSPVTS